MYLQPENETGKYVKGLKLKLQHDELGRAKITYALLAIDKNEALQLEVGFEINGRLLGNKLEDGVEDIPPYESFCRLHLDEVGDAEGKRRGIAKEQLSKLLQEEVPFEFPEEFLTRFTEEAEDSFLPKMVDVEIIVKAQESGSKIYHNIYFPRQKPKAMTVAQLKAKMKAVSY